MEWCTHREQRWVEGLAVEGIAMQRVGELAEGREVAAIAPLQAGVPHIRALAAVAHHAPPAGRCTLKPYIQGGELEGHGLKP